MLNYKQFVSQYGKRPRDIVFETTKVDTYAECALLIRDCLESVSKVKTVKGEAFRVVDLGTWNDFVDTLAQGRRPEKKEGGLITM